MKSINFLINSPTFTASKQQSQPSEFRLSRGSSTISSAAPSIARSVFQAINDDLSDDDESEDSGDIKSLIELAKKAAVGVVTKQQQP